MFVATDCVKKKKNRSVWQKKWLHERYKYSHLQLLKELKESDPEDYKNYLRMDENVFNELLDLVRPHLTKRDTQMRQSIPPEERLIATLRFLATGRSYADLKYSTGISAQALGYIIPETCRVLFNVLKGEYMRVSNLYTLK